MHPHINFTYLFVAVIFGLVGFTLGGLVGMNSNKMRYETPLIHVLDECQDILSQARVLTADQIARFNVIRVYLNLRPYQSKLRLKDVEESK